MDGSPMPQVLALASGIAIAAACGLRAFLPLLALGLAARFGWFHLKPGTEWLAGDLALWALGIATVLELVSDKVPLVDHALDAVGTVLRPAAAWLGAFAMLQGWGSPWAQLAALVLGAGALAVHGVKAKTRLTSTAFTAGHASPLLSVLEDSGALALIAAAVLAPLVALGLVFVLVLVVLRWRRRRSPAILAR